MNIIIYLIAGAIVGYIASRIMNTNSQQGLILDIVVGVIGAFLAGYFISPLLGIGTINDAITIHDNEYNIKNLNSLFRLEEGFE